MEEQAIFLSSQEYLDSEQQSRIRREYVRGSVFAMTGGTLDHNTITGNIFTLLSNHLDGSSCRVYMLDVKVRAEKADCYYYPDVLVSCQPYDGKNTVIHNPRLIVEVLSPSTQQIDRREKLAVYREIPSLIQYFVVHQNKALVELHTKVENGSWVQTNCYRDHEIRMEASPERILVVPVMKFYKGLDPLCLVKEPEEEYNVR